MWQPQRKAPRLSPLTPHSCFPPAALPCPDPAGQKAPCQVSTEPNSIYSHPSVCRNLQALHSSAAVRVQLLRIQHMLLWAHCSRSLQVIICPSSLLGWEEAELHYLPCFCTACWCSKGLEAKCKVVVKGYSWVARGPAPMVTQHAWLYIGPALAELDSPRFQPESVKCLSSCF